LSLKKEILKRYSLIMFAAILLSFVIAVKIIVLQSVKKDKLEQEVKPIVPMDIEPKRGDIYDSRGRLLATSLPLYDIYFDPNVEALTDSIFYADIDSLAIMLSKYFGEKSPSYYSKKFKEAREKGKRYVEVAKELNYNQLQDIKKFPIFRRGRYKGGFISEVKYRRLNPYGNLALKTIGKFKEDGVTTGLEGAYDSYLEGTSGYGIFRKLPSGYKEAFAIKVKPKDGVDVVSTLDVDIQDIVEQALLKQLKETQAEFGVVVLMDVKTGDVKAMANLGKVRDSVYKELMNYAVSYIYEPGSVMKLASMIALFEEKDVPLNQKVDTKNGVLRLTNDFAIKDYNAAQGGFGVLTVKEVFEKSSNVGVAKLVMSNFNTREKQMEFIQRLRTMYIGLPLNIEMEGERSLPLKEPTFNSRDRNSGWWAGSLAELSIGYEMMLTPLQILTFYNAVANNGRMVKPHFVDRVEKNGEVIKEFKPEVLVSSIATKKTLNKVKKMLVGVVDTGTAKKYVKSDLVRIAGKTGTAQIYNDSLSQYSRKDYNVTFVGYFPADNPKYSMIVMLNKPKKHKSGGSGAGPVFKEIAEQLYISDYSMHPEKDYNVALMPKKKGTPKVKSGYRKEIVSALSELKVPVKDHTNNKSAWVSTYSTSNAVVLTRFKKPQSRYEMFNFMGFGAKDAVFILDGLKLKVNLEGRGKVFKQSIAPGEKYSKGSLMKLYMN